ncbi:MAG TPA: ABC transporter ATP-binding protein, partial [Firmicutes bacterium]|nr:ABC transporter ATP-binding protein [Bacillota bacterium]
MKIEIKNLVKKFSDVVAIDNLSVSFNEGITGLVGHNG